MILQSLHLKDNNPKDEGVCHNKMITEDSKTVLRYLSSHPLQAIKDDEGCDVLVFPQSFKDTADDIKDSYVLNYVEDANGNPDYIGTGNLVGFIGYKNIEISIHSRFSSASDDAKDYFLYYMLEKVLAINMFNMPTSASNQDMVFDFLLFFFPKMLKEAMSQGLYKKYVYHEYNDSNVRGVIDINRHIRQNIPANGRIAYRTREFSYDNPITQLIRHTIEFIRRKPFGQAVLHNDSDTETCVQQIIQATPSYTPRQQQSVINDNLRPIAHPYYTKYAALQKLCLSILRHEKLSYGQANDNKIHGILIDAAWLWEEYIARVLSDNGSSLKHYTQNDRQKYYLFERTDKTVFQQIVPDYYDDGNKVVADAKYIPLEQYDRLSGDRLEAVYYKTIMYMYRFNSTTGFLFHPVKNCDSSRPSVVNNEYTIKDTKGHLKKIGLVVPGGPNLQYQDFKKEINNAEQKFRDEIG